jgi:hypothetical protein
VTRRKAGELGVLAAIGVVAACAYGPALGGEFAYDDVYFVVENDAIKAPSRALEWVLTAESASEGKRWGTIFRPLRTLSYGLDHAGFRLNPVGYHLTSLALHLVAVVAVWALARRWSGSPAGALAGAAVFALHPLPSEAVAWIGARADVLGAVGALAFALLALRPGGGWRARVAEAALLVLALGCKEACAGAVPAMALARGLRDPAPGAWRRAARWAVGPTLVVGAYMLLRARILGHTTRYGWLVDDHLGWSLCTVLQARVWDVGRVLRPSDLTIDYDFVPYVRSLAEPGLWLALVATAAAGWCAWRCRRVAPAVTFGIAWWVALLLPVSQLVPLNALMADRWLHLPFAGLACVIAAGVAALTPRLRSPAARWSAVAVTVTVVGAMAAGTWRRARDWRTEEGLWNAAIRVAPDDAGLYLARGQVRAQQAAPRRGADPAAVASVLAATIADFSHSLDVQPREDDAARVAQTCLELGVPGMARRAVDHGLLGSADSFVLQATRAEALWRLGERAAAEAAFAAVLARPEAPRAAVDRVRAGEIVYVQSAQGVAPPEGERAAVRALVRQRLARLRLEAGDLAGARAELERALADWPASEMTPCYLAQVERDAGDLPAARRRVEALIARGVRVESAHLQAAEYALEAGDPAGAVRVLAAAVTQWPFGARHWVGLAQAAREGGQPLAEAIYAGRVQDLGVPPVPRRPRGP